MATEYRLLPVVRRISSEMVAPSGKITPPVPVLTSTNGYSFKTDVEKLISPEKRNEFFVKETHFDGNGKISSESSTTSVGHWLGMYERGSLTLN